MIAHLSEPYLRAATIADAPALARLRAKGLAEQGLLPESECEAFVPTALREFRRLFAAKRIIARLAVDNGEIVACASVVFWERLPYPGSSLHAEIAGVYVAPSCRMRGLATRLTLEAIDDARSHGVRKIFLHPSAQAKGLYRRLGFVENKQLELPVLTNRFANASHYDRLDASDEK
jgi:ribosomal protein S18 acetylase RimI-like enzyme